MEAEPTLVIPTLEQLSLGHGPSKLTQADVERLAKYAWYPPGVSYGMVSLFQSHYSVGDQNYRIEIYFP